MGNINHKWEPQMNKYEKFYDKTRKRVGQKHRKIVEEHYGVTLGDDEIVHHINGVKNDNRLENLVILKSSEHKRLHIKEKPIHKTLYRVVDDIPTDVIVGDTISCRKFRYRKFIGSVCECGKNYWQRQDRKQYSCSMPCGIKIAWKDGKYNDRKQKRKKLSD